MSEAGLSQLHLDNAIRTGLQLFAASQACICAGFKLEFQKQVVTTATEFALHARRVCELYDLRDYPSPMEPLSLFHGGMVDSILVEKDFFFSLNRLVHARTMTVVYVVHPKRSIFRDEDNFVVSFVDVSTDKHPNAHVSLFGVSSHFLTKIVPAVHNGVSVAKNWLKKAHD